LRAGDEGGDAGGDEGGDAGGDCADGWRWRLALEAGATRARVGGVIRAALSCGGFRTHTDRVSLQEHV